MSSYSAKIAPFSILLCYALSLKGETLPETIERVIPSVVKIKIQRSELQTEENELLSIDSGGSGFILDQNHHVVTNAHVVKDAKKIIVVDKEQNEYNAALIGKDEKTDIAVLEVNSFDAPILDENKSAVLKAGEKVFAIGSPYSLGHTTSFGIVSAVERFLANYPYIGFIQTDAAINPGNSGGPLFNEKGELIGMNSTYFSKQGNFTNIGFAIPIKEVHRISDELISNNKIKRGSMGARMVVSERYARKLGYTQGVLVTAVTKGSASENAGLQPGDMIIKIDDKLLSDGGELHRRIERSRPGEIINITLIRNKNSLTLNVKLDEIKYLISNEITNVAIDDTANKMGLILSEKNNVLEVITSHMTAKDIGLIQGDLIIEMNGRKIQSINELNIQLNKLKQLELGMLTIERNKNRFILPIGSKTALKVYPQDN